MIKVSVVGITMIILYHYKPTIPVSIFIDISMYSSSHLNIANYRHLILICMQFFQI